MPMHKKSKGEQPIYSTMSEVASLTSLCAALRTIEAEWSRIVGAQLSRRSAPASYEDGVLVVTVDCQAALQDMNFKKAGLTRAIRERSMLHIDEIRVEVGKPKPAKSVISRNVPAHRNVRNIRKADEATVEALALEITSEHPHMDPELAKIIARCRTISELTEKPGSII